MATKTESGWVYNVYLGIYSRRDKAIGWRFYGAFEDLSDAKREARKLRISRVEEARTIFEVGSIEAIEAASADKE